MGVRAWGYVYVWVGRYRVVLGVWVVGMSRVDGVKVGLCMCR